MFLIFLIINWSLSLGNHQRLGSNRLLLNTYKTIDLSGSLDVNYLVHNSAFWRSLEVNFEVYMKFICSEHGVNLVQPLVLAQLYVHFSSCIDRS